MSVPVRYGLCLVLKDSSPDVAHFRKKAEGLKLTRIRVKYQVNSQPIASEFYGFLPKQTAAAPNDAKRSVSASN
jgi:hypothetical protein